MKVIEGVAHTAECVFIHLVTNIRNPFLEGRVPAYRGLPSVPAHRSAVLCSNFRGRRRKSVDARPYLAARGSNGPHRVHFQGRWFTAGMGFGSDGNLHVMAQ
jgi:hypothetical protein